MKKVIYKSNIVIKSNLGNVFKLHSYKLFNNIYGIFQNKTFNNEEVDYSFSLSKREICDMLNIDSNSYQSKHIIEKTLEDLKTTNIELRKFEYKGKRIEWSLNTVLTKVHSELINGELIFFLELDNLLFDLIKENNIIKFNKDIKNIDKKEKNKGFTKIDLNEINKLNSVNSIKLYNHLRSIENLPKQNKYYDLDFFNELFYLKNDNRNNKRVLDRCIVDINKNVDINVSYYNERHTYKFIFKKHSINIEREVNAKTKKDELMIDNILEKIK